ncbi:hypothetical protein RchiOBHm_Chr5g0042321 [Rosa chinensis]|uniref:Uncharacterized protein n=1 Tax=Rosa chinensis TaxID=74649 RepID=A0A2P6QD16_ROSCH|nr:hypothetical protein RchiOBHm_Chr5g0042321 [Rosa chinensis]
MPLLLTLARPKQCFVLLEWQPSFVFHRHRYIQLLLCENCSRVAKLAS